MQLGPKDLQTQCIACVTSPHKKDDSNGDATGGCGHVGDGVLGPLASKAGHAGEQHGWAIVGVDAYKKKVARWTRMTTPTGIKE